MEVFYSTHPVDRTDKHVGRKRRLDGSDAELEVSDSEQDGELVYTFGKAICCPKASEYTILASHPVLAADAAHLRGPVQGFIMTFSILTVHTHAPSHYTRSSNICGFVVRSLMCGVSIFITAFHELGVVLVCVCPAGIEYL